MLTEDILYRPVHELAPMIKARRLSPVELTRACLARIETLDPRLNTFAAVTAERALAEAREAESAIAAGRYRGPLHGIPYGAKDLLSTRGTPTTWGAKPLVRQMIDADAAVIEKLRAAGAILLGKLAMIELAGGLGYSKGTASATGGTHNPWGLDRWTCGSSSGSGAAVAAALVPFAIGSETWGSIVCPSSFCGDSGLRPTFGRVSRRGAMALSWSLDKLGPLARSARDCETVLSAIGGHDPADPYSLDEPPAAPGDPKTVRGLKVAWFDRGFDKQGDKEVEKVFRKALADLEAAGVRAEPAKLPDLPFESAAAVILTAEAATAFEELEKSGQARDLASFQAPLSFISARAVHGADYVKAQRVRTVCQKAMADFFSRYDLLLYPGEMYPAWKLDADFSDIQETDPIGGAGNLCGLPALSVPCGFAPDGLPAGLAAMAGAFEESKLVAFGRFYQEITGWHAKRPPLPSA